MTSSQAQQYFESFWLSDLDLPEEDWFGHWEGVVPGTTIPISVTIEGDWGWKDYGEWTSDALPAVAIGSYGSYGYTKVGVTIELGAPSSFVELKMDDFDYEFYGGSDAIEWIGDLNATLGAPDSIVTTGSVDDAQMDYFPSEDGGSLRHTGRLSNSVAGIGLATWNDFNNTLITFSVNRVSEGPHWALFDVRLGNPAPVPEPSGALFAGIAGSALLLRRRRNAA